MVIFPFNGEPRSHWKGYVMRLFLILLLALAFNAQQVSACDIRGDQVQTTTLKDFKTKNGNKIACSDIDYEEFPILRQMARGDIGEVRCLDKSTLKGGSGTIANIDARTTYYFFQDRLAAVGADFSSSDYPKMETAFRQKWGKPSSEETAVYSNGLGGVFEGKELLWTKPTCTIGLTQYSRNRDVSMFLMTSPLFDRFLDVQEKTPPAAPDL